MIENSFARVKSLELLLYSDISNDSVFIEDLFIGSNFNYVLINEFDKVDFNTSKWLSFLFILSSDNDKVIDLIEKVHNQENKLPIIIIGDNLSSDFKINALSNGCSQVLDYHLDKREIFINIERRISDYYEFRELEQNRFSGLINSISPVQATFEEILGETEFELLFNEATIGIAIGDPNGSIINANNHMGELVGYDLDILLGMHIKDLFTEDALKNTPLRFDLLKKGKSIISRRTIRRFNGELIEIEMHSSQLTDNRYLAFFYNISERVLVENALLESEEKYRTLFEKSKRPALLIHDNKYVDCNKAAEEIIGYNRSEILNVHPSFISSQFQPDGFESVIKADLMIKIAIEKGYHKFEWEHTTSNGEIFPVEVDLTKINVDGKSMIYVVWQDLRDIKKSLKALEESEANFKVLTESTATGIIVYNSERIVYSNNAIQEITKYSGQELSQMQFFDVIHPDCKEKVKNRGRRRLQGIDELGKYEFNIITKAGDEKWLNVSASPINWKGNNCVVVSCIEITARKNANLQLVENELRYRTLFEFSPGGIVLINEKGFIVEVNESFCLDLGFSKEEVQGKHITFIANDQEAQFVNSNLKRILNGENLHHEVFNKNSDGSYRIRELNETRIKFPDGSYGVMSVSMDVTEKKKIELELEKLSQVVIQSSDSIIITDTSGNIEYVNPKFSTLTGYSFDEVVGKNPKILKSNNLSNEFYADLWKTISSGNVWKGQFLNLKKNGESYYEDAVISSYKDNNGNIEGYFATKVDVTEKRRTEQIQRVLFNVSNAAVTSISLVELNQIIKSELSVFFDTSNFIIALYDAKTDEIDIPFIYDEHDEFEKISAEKTLTAYVIRHRQSLLADEEMFEKLCDQGEVKLVGTPSKLWMGVPLISKGRAIGAIVMQDYNNPLAFTTNDLKLMEIISFQVSVAIERKKYEEGLKYALEKAKENDRLKSSFLATMSHELRTPLNAVIGFSSLVNRETSIENIITYAKVIKQSGTHLLEIVEDIFDITLIESGQISICKETIILNDILNEIFGIIRAEQIELEKYFVEIIFDENQEYNFIEIFTDKRRFKQILLNLLKNALKFTENGTINFGYEIEIEKEQLLFYVKDTGIGIHKDKFELIFDVFRQVDDSNTRLYGGVGLGLSVTKKLTGLLGGDIWVESEVGKGTAFYFTLPFNEGIRKIKQNITISEDRYSFLKGKTILIAEDMADSYTLLKILLQSKGVETIWAENGKVAIDFIKNNNDIDLVLMDINMPIINGYDATKEIKRINPKMQIIAQTAYAVSGERELAFDAGCNDYIEKPIVSELLFATVLKALKREL